MPFRRFARCVVTAGVVGLSVLGAQEAHAFCGFYVAKADASLYNQASQVVLVRDGDRTVISMMNDYQGAPKDFALVVPVPTVLEEGQVHVGDRQLFERIDAFTAPRLVEYHDPNPCAPRMDRMMSMPSSGMMTMEMAASPERRKSLGVTIERKFTVGEYDILILSAKQSDGLETWLRENDYRIPAGASVALQPYIRQGLKFFVAKVNLREHANAGLTNLRPLQFAFESEKFMLPVRLGMLNAQGPQDLIVYVLTKQGRVETTNYRTVKLPTGMDLPVYVKDEFADFYRAMFERQAQKENLRAVFTEYFWNMGWCDPCAANPLTPEELRKLGVFWLDRPSPAGGQGLRAPQPIPRRGGPVPVVVTRLHLRYTPDSLPEDLVFQETGDRQNFQGRYVLRHPWSGDLSCAQGEQYASGLRTRQEAEARTLADLTGWSLSEIRAKMSLDVAPPPPTQPWWQRLWED